MALVKAVKHYKVWNRIGYDAINLLPSIVAGIEIVKYSLNSKICNNGQPLILVLVTAVTQPIILYILQT